MRQCDFSRLSYQVKALISNNVRVSCHYGNYLSWNANECWSPTIPVKSIIIFSSPPTPGLIDLWGYGCWSEQMKIIQAINSVTAIRCKQRPRQWRTPGFSTGAALVGRYGTRQGYRMVGQRVLTLLVFFAERLCLVSADGQVHDLGGPWSIYSRQIAIITDALAYKREWLMVCNNNSWPIFLSVRWRACVPECGANAQRRH